MSEKYLDGKIAISSLAAPTPEDIAKLSALSKDERSALLSEALLRGENSGISTKNIDEIWDSAVLKARKLQANSEHAL